MNNAIVNIAAYHFFTIHNINEARDILLSQCKQLQLKGTILLSKEGINIMLAGERHAIDSIILFFKETFPELRNIPFKESYSKFIPFEKMKVKRKQAIIPFDAENLCIEQDKTKRITPLQLKQMLDNQEDFILLDTRNHYEITYGTFNKAQHLNISEFTQFAHASSEQLLDKTKPIVMFCTGGIRCEKAQPYLTSQGFQKVYQLDGGILNYFKECGDVHYQGRCFVFDERTTVDASLGNVNLN